jgi:hypothetical protein
VSPTAVQVTTYVDVIRQARARGIEFAVGGGSAVAVYTSARESTKDIDLYVLPEDRERMIEVVKDCGLRDYYEVRPYDRGWIYRGYVDDAIVDVMWSMPNQRTQVDLDWLRRGPEVDLYGEQVRILPREELIWAKLYVLQRDRSDWPDILNLIYCTASKLDWDHLVRRIGDDGPLLGAVLTIFRWLCPEKAHVVPARVWKRLVSQCTEPRGGIPRPNLLDTRPWFVPALDHTIKATERS